MPNKINGTTQKIVDELGERLDNQENYSNYLSENIDKLFNKKSKRMEIFMIFYINVDGLTRQQIKDHLDRHINDYKIDGSSYNINYIWIPVHNQETKVEIINPSLMNGDIIKTFKNLVDTLDKDEYRDLMNELRTKWVI